MSSGHRNLGAHRGIAVHVIDVAAQGGIGIMQQSVREPTGRTVDLHRRMRSVFLKSSCATPYQPKFWIRIESPVPDPTAQEKILTWNPEATHRRVTFQRGFYLGGQ